MKKNSSRHIADAQGRVQIPGLIVPVYFSCREGRREKVVQGICHWHSEKGVAMLSSALNSETAIRVNIRMIRIFTKMREVLLTNKDILL